VTVLPCVSVTLSVWPWLFLVLLLVCTTPPGMLVPAPALLNVTVALRPLYVVALRATLPLTEGSLAWVTRFRTS